MLAGRSRRYRRKLSTLVEEHLGYQIQQPSKKSPISSFILNKLQNHQHSCGINDPSNSTKEAPKDNIPNNNCSGHSSIEDSAAALLLYSKFSYEWEKYLHWPLSRYFLNKTCRSPLEKKISIYVDGCNVPIGLRRRKIYDDPFIAHVGSTEDDSVSKDSCFSSIYTHYQLVSTINSKTFINSSHSISTCLIDWAPIVRSIVLNPLSSISKVSA